MATASQLSPSSQLALLGSYSGPPGIIKLALLGSYQWPS